MTEQGRNGRYHHCIV